MRAIDRAVIHVGQVGPAKLDQEDFVEARPDSGLGPVP
ncbi:hypothetical protein C9F11_45085 (plasmid) [Streptomyces sp. YIM 121038]|nr:hypothetical protein C9F11_45085 [Streptomyces sp. YIM 121038]